MENITMTNPTQNTRVRFACPQIADRNLSVDSNISVDRNRSIGVDRAYQGTGLSAFGFGAKGGFGSDLTISTVTPVPTFYAPMHQAVAVKDVVHLRSWSPPV